MNWPRRWVPALVVALFLASGSASSHLVGADADALYRPRVGAASRRTDPLDWVLRRLEARNDEWAAEGVSEELGGRLHLFEEALLDPTRRPALLEELLAPELEAAPLDGEQVETHRGAIGTAWRLKSPGGNGGVPLGRAAFIDALQRFLVPFLRVEKAKFKTVRVESEGDPAIGAQTETLLEFDGPLPDGWRSQRRVELYLGWKNEGSWRISRLAVRTVEGSSVPQPFYSDVTEAILGANSSYQQHLRHGLDVWRNRLDAASGLEIYGHQGLAVADVDGDGLEDFLFAQAAGLPNRLYRATRDGTFVDATADAGVGVLDETGAVLFFDGDNDGDQDLLVVTPLEALLFANDGRGRFALKTDAGLEAAGARRASLIGAAAADYDLDGDLDLYLVSYVFWAGAASRLTSAYPFPYHDAQNGAPNFLFRNEGGLRFRDATEEIGLNTNNRRFSLAASWCDYDQDGDPDLAVANDFGKKNLYRNDGGRFRDVAEELGVEDTGNGMSVAWCDVDTDGFEDLSFGNMWSSAGSRLSAHPGFRRGQSGSAALYARMAQGNSLYRNLGNGRFENATERSGLAFGRWAWSSQFFDADGDGLDDHYVVNGFVTGPKKDDL